MTLAQTQKSIEVFNRKIHFGRGTHGCVILAPQGMGTNAICQCNPRDIARTLLDITVQIEAQRTWEKN